MLSENEPKKRKGRPRKIDLLSNDTEVFLEIRHRGARLYTFRVGYKLDGPVVLVTSFAAFVNQKDYPIEDVIRNCGPTKIRNLITKALWSEGVDRTTSVVFSAQLQPYLE